MNPWTTLPSRPPFVTPADLPYVETFNSGEREYHGAWIHTGRVPEPRQGPIDAPIVMLQQNPSYSGRPPQAPLSEPEAAKLRDALIDEGSPHLGLRSPNDWWDRTCKALLAKFGRERLATRLVSIEYFPYPSAKFAHEALRLPSQSYTFALVRAGLSRGAHFVITRGANLWFGAVPELYSFQEKCVFRTKSPQNASLTPGNLPAGVFDRLCALI